MSDIDFSFINNLAIEQSAVPVKISSGGKEHEVIIRQLSDVSSVLNLSEATEKREKAFEALKNRIMVTVPRSAIAGYEDRFKDFKELADDKVEFPVTKKEEIALATQLEQGVIDIDGKGAISFNAGIVLSRLNFILVSKIIESFRKINQEMISEQAKND